MQNRRVRRPAQGLTSTKVPAHSARPLKPWLIVCCMLFLGAFMFSGGSEKTKVTASAEPVPVATEPVLTPFPSINTQVFTQIQQKMLKYMQIEYSKRPKSFDKTVLEYTEGVKESWCADFISVIRFEAGKPFTNPETGYWRIPGVLSLRDYYAASDAYHFVGAYTPKFGDVAFYFGKTPDGNSREHVAFVLEVRGDKLVTLGGNETEKGILQVRYDKLSEGEVGLAGFGESSL